MEKTIIDSVWYGSTIFHIPISVNNESLNFRRDVVSGAVLIWNGYNFKAYIGASGEGDENLDAEFIARWGNHISFEVAYAIFGDKEYEGKRLVDNYI